MTVGISWAAAQANRDACFHLSEGGAYKHAWWAVVAALVVVEDGNPEAIEWLGYAAVSIGWFVPECLLGGVWFLPQRLLVILEV